MPQVTIGVPVYNGEKYLDGALEALCAQTYQDLEIFISDNGSTDSTPNTIKKWAAQDTRIHHVRHDETMPAKEHFKWVIKQSTSPYFCYAAYDDLWSENYIEGLIEPINKNPNALVSIPKTYGIEEDGTQKDEKIYRPVPTNISKFEVIKCNFKNIKSAVFYALYNRDFLDKNLDGGQYFNHTWGIDFQLFLNFIFTDLVVGNNDAIFYQRYTGISDTRYRPKTAEDQWVHYRDFIKEIWFHYRQSDLSIFDKIRLIPILHRYANNVVKPRRIVKAWVKEKLNKGSAV